MSKKALMNDNDLVDKIKARTFIEASNKVLPAPATENKLCIVEAALNFPLPLILRKLYLNVSCGHFGPGKGGIFCLPDHAINFLEHSLLEWYFGFRCDREIDKPEWPSGLLLICAWGDSIYSAIDCTQNPSPVIRVDYNLDSSWVERHQSTKSGLILFKPYSNQEVASWVEASSLNVWLENWINGNDIFHDTYPVSPS